MIATKLSDSAEAGILLRVSIYCLVGLQTLSQLWFTWLCWHESRSEVSSYRFPCPITQGLKSVWTCPLQHLSAPQRLLPAFKRTTLPSSLTLQGTCGRMQRSALWLSGWICIKFLRIHAFYNESEALQKIHRAFRGAKVSQQEKLLLIQSRVWFTSPKTNRFLVC